MKQNLSEPEVQLVILQQFIHIKEEIPTFTTWYRIGPDKRKVEKPITLQPYELDQLKRTDFIERNMPITNFQI